MKFKKVMSLALALIMATALMVPALAADANTQNAEMAGTTKVGTVTLSVDKKSSLVFNPAKLSLSVTDGAVVESGGTTTKDQVIIPGITITNKSTLPLSMVATVGIAIADVQEGETKATVASSAPTDSQTSKQIFVETDYAVYDSTLANVRKNAWLEASHLVAGAGSKNEDGSVSGGKTHSANQAVKIPATDGSDDGKNFVYVKFSGSATKAPTVPWTVNDKFNVITTLKFTPQTNEDDVILVATKPKGDDGNFAALDATGKPIFEVTYSNTALNPANPQQSGASDKNIFQDASGTYTAGNIHGGYLVVVRPAVSSGKYYAISNITFRNEDGTTNSMKATKEPGNKNSNAYWTFTMPNTNIQAIVTVASEAT